MQEVDRRTLSFGGGVGQVLGKVVPSSSSKLISGFWRRNVHLWWVDCELVWVCMCPCGESVLTGCRSLSFLLSSSRGAVTDLRPARDRNTAPFFYFFNLFILTSASGSRASLPLITWFYPWKRRAVIAHRGWQEISRSALLQRVASSFSSSSAHKQHIGPFVCKICC